MKMYTFPCNIVLLVTEKKKKKYADVDKDMAGFSISKVPRKVHDCLILLGGYLPR